MEDKKIINRTTQFILPLIIKPEEIDNFNAYLGIDRFDDISGDIYITLADNLSQKVGDNILKILPNYRGMLFVKEKPVYIVKLDDKYLNDYYNFLIGNYTEMEESTRREIYQFWFKTKHKDIENIIFNTLMDPDSIRPFLLNELLTGNRMDEYTISKSLKQVHEVNSIPKLKEELLLN